MAHVTTRNYLIDRAPRRIALLGDKTKKPEPASRIIEFPGGAIELFCTSGGDYLAHIIVHPDFALPGEVAEPEGAIGEIVDLRMEYAFPSRPNLLPRPQPSEPPPNP